MNSSFHVETQWPTLIQEEYKNNDDFFESLPAGWPFDPFEQGHFPQSEYSL